MRWGCARSGCPEGCLCSGLAETLKRSMALTHAPLFSTPSPACPRHLMPLCSLCLFSNVPLLLALHPCVGACTRPAPVLTCQSTLHPPRQFLSTIPSCAAPVPFSFPVPHPVSLTTTPSSQPSALLVLRASLLQTVPGQLDLLASACALGVGCCLAAPGGGKSHFLPPLFPEHDMEGGSGWLPQRWDGKGCSLKGQVGGPSAPGLQAPTLFQQRAVCSFEAGGYSMRALLTVLFV